MRYLLLALVFSFICKNTYSQPLGIDLLGNKTEIEIPFELRQGFILVDIELDKTLPLTFIFDTGAEHTILFHKIMADLIDLEYAKRIRIMGSDLSDDIYALIVRNLYLDVKKAYTVTRDILVLEDELSKLTETVGVEIDGILGASFFKGMVVYIDYRRKKIKIQHPDSFVTPTDKSYKEFNILVDQNKPYLDVPIEMQDGRIVDCKLLIDTGAAIPLLLHSNTDSNLVIPEYVITGNLGYGLGGAIKGFLGKVRKLSIGEYHLDYLLTSFQDVDSVAYETSKIIRNGILGNKLLARFDVIINYMQGKLYLKARKKYNEEFEYDKSGLEIIALGRELKDFYVKNVFPNTPAAEVDIRAGDVIKKIGMWKAKWFTLEKLTDKLQSKPGKKISLQIVRDGQTLNKKFRLRDLLIKPGK